MATGEISRRKPVKALALALAFVAAPLAAHPSVGIVRDGRGNVFYSDLTHVWKIPPAGGKTIAVRNVHTHELCLDAAGNLFGEHLWYEGDATKKWGHRVWRLGADGSLSDVYGPREGFRTDYSFVRDAAGAMYWWEGEKAARFRKRAPDGTVSTLAECPACRDVRWMTAARDGTLFFVDSGEVREVSPAGVVRTRARGLLKRVITQPQVADIHALMGLWCDAAGRVYVARYGSREVLRIDRDDSVRVVATSTFPWSPTGGLMAPNGDLLLLETTITNAVRVRRIGVDGRTETY
jgi:hypothetical protein